MKRVLFFLAALVMALAIYGCIVSYYPTDLTPMVDNGSQLAFGVEVNPADATFVWELDNVVIPGLIGNSYNYEPEVDGQFSHTLKVTATTSMGDDELTWKITNGDLADGLIAFYPMNNNANDVSGNGYDGTIMGATFESGCAVFDGDDYIYVPYGGGDDPFDLTTYTIAAWFNSADLGSLGCVLAHGNVQYSIYHDSSSPALVSYYDNVATHKLETGDGLSQDVWYFVAVTLDDSGNWKLYIDGDEVASDVVADLPADEAAALFIGARNATTQCFTGKIDEVRIYDRVLDWDEIDGLYDLDAGSHQNAMSVTFSPLESTLMVDGNVLFSVTSVTPLPATYQWYLDDAPVSGTTGRWYVPNLTDGIIEHTIRVEVTTAVGMQSMEWTILDEEGVRAYYPFDVDASDAFGYLGTYRDGNVVGDVSFDGEAANFDGDGDYIEMNYSAIRPNIFSISVWFNSTMSTRGSIINTCADATDNFGYALWGGKDGVAGWPAYFFIDQSQASGGDWARINSDQSFNDGAWHHLCATYDGTDMKMYVDGNLQTDTAVTTYANSNAATQVGRQIGYTEYDFNGAIDELRIYDRALTQAEIDYLSAER
ncbi:MAG: hypothetical protein JW920_05800 [Deltaproteobacteria bacterium]|nr:hypothetical protein [Deltaproteobacteria bacterium]